LRAAIISVAGRPPVLRPVEQAGATIEVLAAPITPLDLLCASGTSYFGPDLVHPVTGQVHGVENDVLRS
jgi:NADPH:quinone reductase